MKTILFILVMLFPVVDLAAQNFSLSPNPVWSRGESSKYDITAYSSVTNNESSTVSYRWVRIRNVKIKEWKTAVCDINTCYTPVVDSADFQLNAGQKGPLQGHFYVSNTTGADTLMVAVFKISDPSDADTAYFYATAVPVGTMSISTNYILNEVVPSQDTVVYQTTITNTSTTTNAYKIKDVSVSFPGSWESSVLCDTSVGTDTTVFSLAPNSNIMITAKVNSKSNKGEGSIKIVLYPDTYPGYVDTITFSMRAWPTGLPASVKQNPVIQVYPNPSTDIINIIMNTTGVNRIYIYNLLGQEINQIKPHLNTNHISYSVENIPDGIYFIKCEDGNGNLYTRKFVKNHNTSL